MQTLESVQTRHNAILRAFNQVESILAPIHTGEGKKDCINIIPFNLERLAKHSDLLSSDICGVQVITEKSDLPGFHPCNHGDTFKVKIEGEDFGYSFAPELICDAKKRIEKGFKKVEAYIKKQPAQIEKIEPVKNKPEKIDNDIKKVYICHSENTIDELKTVTFQIEGKYIDQIKAGTKVEDYRSISDHNVKLLCDNINPALFKKNDQCVTHGKETWRPKKDVTHVKFVNGYRKDRKELICELISINLDEFLDKIPDGMKPGTICFTLEIGQIVEFKNF